MHYSSRSIFTAASLGLLLSTGWASAALIAHYDFTDGDLTDNEVSANYTLTEIGTVTANIDGSAGFSGDDSTKSYLETAALGGSGVANFTVSYWFKTDSFSQGNYQGLFSTNNSSANYSWQLDSTGSNIRLVSKGNTTLSYADSNLSVDTWYNVVIRKESGAGDNYTQVYITAEGEATPHLVMNQDANPGGLNMFRLGVNRNTDSLFRMDMSNVKIYDDSTVDLGTLLTEGPQVVPEPSSSALLGLAALALILHRRK
jgi:hypothetical protein